MLSDSQIVPSFLVLGVVVDRTEGNSIYKPNLGFIFSIRDYGRAFRYRLQVQQGVCSKGKSRGTD